MKILIFLENDLVVRHFIFSKAFKKLNKNHEVVYVFPDGDKRMGAIKTCDLDLDGSRRLTLLPCAERLKLWRYRFFVEKLRNKKGVPKSLIRQWRLNFKNGNPFFAEYLYRFLGLPFIFFVFTKIVNFLISRRKNVDLLEILDREKPDLLIHPSVLEGSYIDDVIFYGNKIKKPVIIIMNSWDNPITKRSVVNKDYFLLVWGPQTKQHAITYMGLDEKNVIEFGSAQFDIYQKIDTNNTIRDNPRSNLNKSTKTLLYAGSSKNCDEFSHLMQLDNAIKSGLIPKINVIYRPHPWGQGGYKGYRFKKQKFEYIEIDENMRNYLLRDFNKEKSKFLPNLENTRTLLKSVDIVISPLSTILLEAMMFGKIPICLMTDNEQQADHFRYAKTLPHFEEMINDEDVIVINGSNNLISGINYALDQSFVREKSDRLKISSEFFISKFDKPFNERLLKLVEKIYQKDY